MEGIFLTAIIDAMEGRDVMSADIPNAFIQTPMPEAKVGEQVIMKSTGVLVKIAPETYGPYVIFESGKKVLYVKLLKAMYGQLIAVLLWYNNSEAIWKVLDMNLTRMIAVLLTKLLMENSTQ